MPFINALSALLYGLGVLALVGGLLGSPFNWKIGIITAISLWLIGVVVRLNTFIYILTALLYGLGVLALVGGLLGSPFNWKMGIVTAILLWVIGTTLYVYTHTRDTEFGNYEPRRLYDR